MRFKTEEGRARIAGNTLQNNCVAANCTKKINASSTSKQAEKAPANTLFANRWNDLPDSVKPVTYRIAGANGKFTVQKKTLQVLEALMIQPVACGSRCRISDRVLLLRRDCGLTIEMKMYKGDGTSQGENYGVYFLKTEIERVEANQTGEAA